MSALYRDLYRKNPPGPLRRRLSPRPPRRTGSAARPPDRIRRIREVSAAPGNAASAGPVTGGYNPAPGGYTLCPAGIRHQRLHLCVRRPAAADPGVTIRHREATRLARYNRCRRTGGYNQGPAATPQCPAARRPADPELQSGTGRLAPMPAHRCPADPAAIIRARRLPPNVRRPNPGGPGGYSQGPAAHPRRTGRADKEKKASRYFSGFHIRCSSSGHRRSAALCQTWRRERRSAADGCAEHGPRSHGHVTAAPTPVPTQPATAGTYTPTLSLSTEYVVFSRERPGTLTWRY